MLKQVRILAGGIIAGPDRVVRTTKAKDKGGPDRVQWVRVGAGSDTYTVHFDSSPFLPGPQDIPVGGGPSSPHEVSQADGVYKYSVRDGSGMVTDDPDVIIE